MKLNDKSQVALGVPTMLVSGTKSLDSFKGSLHAKFPPRDVVHLHLVML
jgi:hypothetical protein